MALVAAVSLTAQEKKAAAGGILHPEMTVENGTWDKPMASIGAKPADTVERDIRRGGSSQQAAAGQAHHGSRGDRGLFVLHPTGEARGKASFVRPEVRAERAADRAPDQDGSLYMLMPEEHDPRRDGGVDAKASASDHMGHIVSVSGTEASVGGYRAIYVQGLTK